MQSLNIRRTNVPRGARRAIKGTPVDVFFVVHAQKCLPCLRIQIKYWKREQDFFQDQNQNQNSFLNTFHAASNFSAYLMSLTDQQFS